MPSVDAVSFDLEEESSGWRSSPAFCRNQTNPPPFSAWRIQTMHGLGRLDLADGRLVAYGGRPQGTSTPCRWFALHEKTGFRSLFQQQKQGWVGRNQQKNMGPRCNPVKRDPCCLVKSPLQDSTTMVLLWHIYRPTAQPPTMNSTMSLQNSWQLLSSGYPELHSSLRTTSQLSLCVKTGNTINCGVPFASPFKPS